MSISRVIMIIMAVFFVLGAFDRLIGNRFGLGAEFERGFGLMGPTALSVLGLMAFAPVLSKILAVVLVPLFGLIGADAGMFPGVLLSCDVGYPVALELASDHRLGLFGGLVVGSTMGFVVSFTIPVACGLIKKEHYRYFATGVLAGYIFDPVACFIGGLAMGIPWLTVLVNLIPVIIIAGMIVAGLLLAPEGTIRVFKWFSKLLMAVITVGLCAAAVEAMTGFTVIKGMDPISNGFKTVGTIVLSLGGSLPLLFVLRKILGKPLNRLGDKLGINDCSMLCILLALTSLVPGYTDFDKMNPKGRILYAAFSASAGCMLGCHLGVTSAVDASVVVPMLISKICAGIFALLSGCYFAAKLTKKEG